MTRLAAHIEANMRNLAFSERIRLVKRLDFQACEFVWRSHDLQEAIDLQKETGLVVSCLGGTTGGKPGGERPVLVWPEDHEKLAVDVQKAVAYAKALASPNLIMTLGNLISGWALARHRAEAVASLKSIVPVLEDAGITVVIEPLNSRVNHRGCYCDTSAEAFAITEAVGSTNVKVLYDIYHMQIMEGNIINTINDHHEMIGYYHVAGVPGRHEPIGGELNFAAVFAAIVETGYNGFIGLEYQPTLEPEASLQQVKQTYLEV